MKSLFACTVALSCCCLFVGCGKESGKGGPGAKPAANDSHDGHHGDDVQNADNTFTITVPSGMTITQGDTETAAISVSRGDQFDQKVSLTVEAPEGIEANPATIEAGAEQDDVEVTLTVADTTAVGEHTVTVKGTPAEGKAVSESFKVTVEEK